MPDERDIDWSSFDSDPQKTCKCNCGAEFRSHVKWTTSNGKISRRPCPLCGRDDNLKEIYSDPEVWEVK